MTSTFSPNKGLEEPASGDYVNAWATPVNANWNAIDAAFGGTTSISVTGISSPTNALTLTQYRSLNIVFSGVLGASIAYQIPAGVGGSWSVNNATSGAFTLTFSIAAGNSIVLNPGRTFIVSDGTSIALTNQLTQASLGLVLYPRTASEISAGVTPTSYIYAPGNLLRYGADPSGATDSSAAITQAMACNTNIIVPSPATFRISTNLTLARGLTFTYVPGGVFSVDVNMQVQIGAQINAGNFQIFAGAGTFITQTNYAYGPGVYNVRWWGAVGDGAADDTTAIQNAANAVSQGVLYFPTGVYNILFVTSGGNGIDMVGSTSIRGDGQFSQLKGIGFSGSNPIISYIGTNASNRSAFSVSNIQFFSDNFGASALFLTYCNSATFENIYLFNLASGVICGTNVYSNIFTIWHLGGVSGRNFLCEADAFNNNTFVGGRFGGTGFSMEHSTGTSGGNRMVGTDFESTNGASAVNLTPSGTGIIEGFSLIGCYSEVNSPLVVAGNSTPGAVSGLFVEGGFFTTQNTGATNAIVVNNVNGVCVRGNTFDGWTTYVINNVGGNTNWDIGPNVAKNIGTGWSNDSGIVVVSNGSTIVTSVATPGSQIFVNPTGSAATGVILTAGTYDGQTCAISNVNGSNSATMAAAGTSRVATGTGCVIGAGTQKIFTWRASGLSTPVWYSN